MGLVKIISKSPGMDIIREIPEDEIRKLVCKYDIDIPKEEKQKLRDKYEPVAVIFKKEGFDQIWKENREFAMMILQMLIERKIEEGATIESILEKLKFLFESKFESKC